MSDDVFRAPDAQDRHEELDPAAAVPGVVVRIAGAALVVAGCFVAASGAQLFVFFTIYDLWMQVVAALLLLSGLVALPLGGFYFQARGWAVFGALAVGGGMALIATLWLFYAMYAGLFSPIMIFAAAFSELALLLVVVGAPGALKASAARNALYR